jgi:DNA-binding winged helix-turn-helix (wHTH) protein
MRARQIMRHRTVPLNLERSVLTSFKACLSVPDVPANDTRHRPGAGPQYGAPLADGDEDSLDPRTIIHCLDRIEALLRRQIEMRETTLRVGTLELDLVDRTARRADRKIDLRPREYDLLKYMMQHSGELLARSTLFEDVWHYKFTPATNLVDVHMGRLRHKIDAPDEVPMIRNVRGAGFILCAEF